MNRERAAVDQAMKSIDHILEQIGKQQYWNALAATNELQKALMEAFDEVLKGKPE